MEKIPVTPAGFNKMQEELKHLKTVERPSVIQDIAEAREHGDLSENAEYHAAREKQSFVEGRIVELEDRISRAQVIDISQLKGETVKFGASIVLVDDETEEEIHYQIVGEDESDISKGLISITSPLARALIGTGAGDTVEVKTPGGIKSYEISKVIYC